MSNTSTIDNALRPIPSLGDIPMAKIQQNPLEFLKSVTREHPDIVHYKTSGWCAIIANHPNYVKHILQTNHRNYTKERSPDLMMLKPMLGNGLMTSDGDNWLHQRQMLQPAFHQQQIEGYLADMAKVTESMLLKWRERASTEAVLDSAGELSHLTLEIVAKCLFGIDLSNDSTDFGEAVTVMNKFMAHFDPWDREGISQFQQALRKIGEVGQRIINERSKSNQEHRDLLSLLLTAEDAQTEQKLTEQQLRDQIFTFLMAGHETTAKALTWSLYVLGTHKDVLAKAQQEAISVLNGRLPTLQDLESLKYCWMVIQEAMRLYTPVWSMTRVAKEEDNIDGYPIRANSLIIISPYTVHRHPDFWPDAETFNPERFDPPKVNQLIPFSYLPFSDGARICIGRRFAMMELRVVLAMLLSRFEIALVPDHPVEPEALVTLRPKYGLPLSIRPLR